MLLTHAEMGCLRLAAWCKDIPQNTSQYIGTDILSQLVHAGCLRQSKCGLSWRLTQKGTMVLERAGFVYTQDKYYRGSGDKLIRRLKMAEIIVLLYSMGIDVFMESPASQGFPTQQKLSFLPSFSLRRAKSSNLIGGTSLSGFLYAPQATFVTYYISDGGREGIHPHAEQKAFLSEYLSCSKATSVIYTGLPDLSQLIQAVNHAAEVKFKNGAVTFKNAMEMFSVPVCFVPLSIYGARQLRIMCQPDYRQRLVRALLEKDEYGSSEYLCFDAINKKHNEPFMVGLDMNLKGFDKALMTAGKQKLYIAVLDFQLETARKYLKNKNVSLYSVSTEAVEAALDLPGLPEPDFSPYQTKEGGYVNVTDF